MKNLRILPLKNRADFLKISKAGKSFACHSFILAGIKSENNGAIRIGFTVSSKNGNAVDRNRIKRRLRAICVMVFPKLGQENFDYVLIARKSALKAHFTKMIAELEVALDKIHKKSK